MLHLPGVLTPAEVSELQQRAARAAWLDGRSTAAGEARDAKRNEQVDENSEDGRAIAALTMQALSRNAMFAQAAFPARVTPLMNRYAPGMTYGMHVDGALMGGRDPLRTDLSGTLFLSDPVDYEGGELLVDGLQGRQSAKLPAGDLVIYPSTQLHAVMPVTRGVRLACVFWVQSIVSDPLQRTLLFEMAQALALLNDVAGARPEFLRLTGIYHRLVQMWARP
jgi:PKHD-type hydroxylase